VFEKLLKKIGACLEHNHLPYMIIGGQAVLLYGEPRLTRDIDITLGLNVGSLDRLLGVVQDLSLYIRRWLKAFDESSNQYEFLQCFEEIVRKI